MKAAVSARLAEAGRERRARRSPLASSIRSTRRERPVISATASCPKRWTIWSSADCTGGSAPSFWISASRLARGLLAEHRVVLGVEDRTRHEVAFIVLEGLLQLHREGMLQEVEHVLAGA